MNRILLSLALVFALAAPAHADNSSNAADRSSLDRASSSSYWEMILGGGMLLPLRDMKTLYKESLAANVRIGWVSRLGLGVDLALDYAPASRNATPADDVYEVHVISAGLMPRFTLGKKMFRVWLAAGGGMTYEHSEHVATSGIGLEGTTNKYAATGMGAAGIEFYAFSGVGLAVTGSYARTYGDLSYEMVNVTGGLAVTFR